MIRGSSSLSRAWAPCPRLAGFPAPTRFSMRKLEDIVDNVDLGLNMVEAV